jgi:hypothetical protein
VKRTIERVTGRSYAAAPAPRSSLVASGKTEVPSNGEPAAGSQPVAVSGQPRAARSQQPGARKPPGARPGARSQLVPVREGAK